MIRFKTIDPAQAEKPAVKQTAPAPMVATPDPDEPAAGDAPSPKGKGLTRKTPLRAKKPAAGLFRD